MLLDVAASSVSVPTEDLYEDDTKTNECNGAHGNEIDEREGSLRYANACARADDRGRQTKREERRRDSEHVSASQGIVDLRTAESARILTFSLPFLPFCMRMRLHSRPANEEGRDTSAPVLLARATVK